jgi:hypothetical protein
MSSRRLLSRLLRSLVVFVRRLTIAVGVLIVFLYFAGLKILAALPYPPCSEWPKTSLANARGDIAEVSVSGCIFGLIKRQYQLRVHPVGSSSAKSRRSFQAKGDAQAQLGRR